MIPSPPSICINAQLTKIRWFLLGFFFWYFGRWIPSAAEAKVVLPQQKITRNSEARTACVQEVIKMFVFPGLAVESIMVSKHSLDFWQSLARSSVGSQTCNAISHVLSAILFIMMMVTSFLCFLSASEKDIPVYFITKWIIPTISLSPPLSLSH